MPSRGAIASGASVLTVGRRQPTPTARGVPLCMSQIDVFDDPFSSGGTLPEALPTSPWGVFRQWWDEAHTGNAGKPVQDNPNAVTVATLGEGGMPSCRVVLCKKMDLDAGWICFFTNYEGRKGRQLAAHAKAAACFHWDSLDRQVRIEGEITRSPAEESDAYFASRALISRLGAWASRQSEPIASREDLLTHYADVMDRFGVGLDTVMNDLRGRGVQIPRPPHWGGFRLWASRVELWIGGQGRFHDRAVWTRELTPGAGGFVGGDWHSTRLQP